MSMKSAMLFAALASVFAVGCGPDLTEPSDPDWMIGVFSSQTPGIADTPEFTTNFTFEADGSFRRQLVETCAAPSLWEGEWSVVADSRVRVPTPDWNGVDALVLERLPDCDEFRISFEVDGNLGSGTTLYRGEICTYDYSCPDEDGEWVPCGCGRVYCDDAGPESLDCE